MSDETAVLKELVASARAILLEAENNLQQLAYAALSSYEQFHTDQGNGQHVDRGEAARRLQQIGQQLAKLSERNKSLQNYLENGLDAPPSDDDRWAQVRILQSQEEERMQLARKLEDAVGQLLANAVFELASCQHLLVSHPEAVSDGLNALQEELEQGLTDIRHLIVDLEPSNILNNFGLGGGVRRYLEQYEARTQIKTQLRINTNIGRLPNIIETAIFRIIQEALHNVHRHAKATQIEVIIEEKDAALEFSVIDNGEGLVSDRIDISRKNLGLARMVDYAELLNGKLRIFSDLERGTRIVLSIPYQSL